MSRLLVFIRGDDLAWMRLDEGRVVARGPTSPAAEPDERIIAVAPGEAVTLHWVEMPDLSPAQAIAAGRIAAGEVCAAPLATSHVAVGARDDDGFYPLAVTDALAMTGWLARCREAGLDPDIVVPATLLMLPPEDGLRVAAAGELVMVRGDRLGFAAEPALAALLMGDAPTEELRGDAFEAGLDAALDALPVNLRQGSFAKITPWQLDTSRIRRMAGLAALALLAMLLVNLAMILRYGIAADVGEMQIETEARAVLPRNSDIQDPIAEVRAFAAERGGSGGFSPLAAALFGALRDVPGAELTSLRYDSAGGLVVAVATAQGGDLAAIQEKLRLAGYESTVGSPRSEMEKAVVDVTVKPR